MPERGKYCKYYTCELIEGALASGEDDKLDIGCKKGHKATGACIVKGNPDCPDYKKGMLYSLDEVKEDLGLK